MRYELEEDGYKNTDNADFFLSEDGTYVFLSTLKNALLGDYIAKYLAQITVDEDLLASVSMKTVKPNYHY
jgi:hypothetical protein